MKAAFFRAFQNKKSAWQRRAFSRWAKLAAAAKKHYGIGLYMAENTAKLHGGKLTISNCADGGAEVKMVLV